MNRKYHSRRYCLRPQGKWRSWNRENKTLWTHGLRALWYTRVWWWSNSGSGLFEYAIRHSIRIEDGVIDTVTQPQVNTASLHEMVYFRPENVPMTDHDQTTGFEYTICGENVAYWVTARNFILSGDTIPSLLFLMIHASKMIPWLKEDDTLLIIRRSIDPNIPYLVIHLTYKELKLEIDHAILRAYPVVCTARKSDVWRRDYIDQHFIQTLLDLNNLGGADIEDEE